jgi:hypothetical protein
MSAAFEHGAIAVASSRPFSSRWICNGGGLNGNIDTPEAAWSGLNGAIDTSDDGCSTG